MLHLLHSLLQEIQLPGHLVGQVVVHLSVEVLPHVLHLLLPELLIQGEQLVEVHLLLQALEVQGVSAGQVADDGGHGAGRAVHPPEHPVQHADVVAETGPEESGGGALAEPVDVEDLGEFGAGAVGHAQPVREVLSEVVAEEGTHGEGVVHDHLACRHEEEEKERKLVNTFLFLNLLSVQTSSLHLKDNVLLSESFNEINAPDEAEEALKYLITRKDWIRTFVFSCSGGL